MIGLSAKVGIEGFFISELRLNFSAKFYYKLL